MQLWKDPAILCNCMSCEQLILSNKALYIMACKLYSFLGFSSPQGLKRIMADYLNSINLSEPLQKKKVQHTFIYAYLPSNINMLLL